MSDAGVATARRGAAAVDGAPAAAAGGAVPARRALAGSALVLVLALLLRAAPIGHGLPRNYVPDTHVVRCALGMAKDHDLVPPVGRYSQYPYLLPYLLLPAYAAQYAAGRAAGAWADARGYGEHLLEHPEDAQLVGRWLVALFGALTPWVVYRAARAAGLGRGAWVAAWLVATGLLHVHFSVQERPWVPMTFFFALAAWPAARHARGGAARDLVLSGVASGLAFACHQGGLGAFAIPGLAWLLGPRGWRGPELGARVAQGALAVLAGLAVGVALGHPYYLVHGATPDAAVIGGGEAVREQGGINIGAMSIVFRARWASVARLARALAGYDPVLVALGLAGIVPALRRRATRAVAVFVVLWTAFFLSNQSDHVRYLLPSTVLLALPAGLAAERMLATTAGRCALAALLALPLVQAVRLDVLLRREDTRAEAERELAALPAATCVAIDRYGPEVELDRASLERLARLRALAGDGLHARERHRLEELALGRATDGGPGIDAVPAEDVFETDQRAGTLAVRPALAPELGTDPLGALRALGVTDVLLVDRRPGAAEDDLLRPLAAPGEPRLVLDPSRGRGTAEAFLPTEMDFPLVGLWTVARPGPRLELRPLAAPR